MAKIASDLRKPDGLVVVAPGEEAEFLSPLPVGKLYGIGPKTAQRLEEDGVETIGQLAAQPMDWFTRRFGQRAASVRAKALGEDQEPVHTERETKSISAETTFTSDLAEPERLRQELSKLASNVAKPLEPQRASRENGDFKGPAGRLHHLYPAGDHPVTHICRGYYTGPGLAACCRWNWPRGSRSDCWELESRPSTTERSFAAIAVR